MAGVGDWETHDFFERMRFDASVYSLHDLDKTYVKRLKFCKIATLA